MTIPEILERQAKQFGDKTFLFFEDAEYSYNRMYEESCRVAVNMAKRGVGNGDKVGLLMGNCVEFLHMFLGLGRIGAVIVPINPVLTPEEIAFVIRDSDMTTLVTIPAFAPMLPLLRQALPQVERVFVLGDGEIEGAESFNTLLEPVEEIPEIAASEDSEASLIYTSGTTGKPKGVVLTHGNYVWNTRGMVQSNRLGPTDRFLCVLPVFHVNAQVVTILTPLMGGVDVVMMGGKFNPFAILPTIAKHKVTIMSAVPTIYNVICGMPKASEFDVSSMNFFVSGAAPMPEDTYQATQRVLQKPLIMGYGLSEATCATAVADAKDPIRWDSVGPVLRYQSVRIVDPDNGDVPVGEVGEIWISGPAVMKGYYKNPEATAEVLKDGWLRTGDLGRMDADGYLYIVGRLKDMIIRGGQNIYPAEIESTISRLEGVAEVCVVGVEEARWGQEVLALIKQGEGGEELTEKGVIAHCHEHLAQYKCPKYVRFVDEFPKTATGKIKKQEMAAQFADLAAKK